MPSCTVSPVFSSSSRSFGRASFATSIRRRTSAPSSKSATPSRYFPVSGFCSRKPALASVEASRCTVLFASRRRVASVVMPSSFSSPENDVSNRIEFATDESRALTACSMSPTSASIRKSGDTGDEKQRRCAQRQRWDWHGLLQQGECCDQEAKESHRGAHPARRARGAAVGDRHHARHPQAVERVSKHHA